MLDDCDHCHFVNYIFVYVHYHKYFLNSFKNCVLKNINTFRGKLTVPSKLTTFFKIFKQRSFKIPNLTCMSVWNYFFFDNLNAQNVNVLLCTGIVLNQYCTNWRSSMPFLRSGISPTFPRRALDSDLHVFSTCKVFELFWAKPFFNKLQIPI